MLCSLNEIEVLVRRSCRGVGLSWGLSYEAGCALRCLASGGVAVLSPLLSYLASVDSCVASCTNEGGEACSFAPVSLAGIEGGDGVEWRARGGEGGSGGLCPIVAGCGLSDGGVEVCGERVMLRGVLSPVLLLGFLLRGIERWRSYVSVSWGGIVVVVGGGGFLVSGEDGNGNAEGLGCVCGDVVVEVCEAGDMLAGDMSRGVFYGVGSFVGDIEVGGEEWDLLGGYAGRGYVVASAGSRERGAG